VVQIGIEILCSGHFAREDIAIQRVVIHKIAVAITGAAILSGTGFILWVKNQPVTPATLAVDTLDNLVKGNSSVIAERIPQEEIEAYGMDRRHAQEILEKFIVPRLREVHADGPMVLNVNEGTGGADAGQRLVTDNKDSLYVSVSATLSPAGTSLKPFFSEALFTAILARHIKPGQSRAERYVKSIVSERSELESYGIKGVQSGNDFKTWDSLISRWQNFKEHGMPP
jgi:hypothetical protein